VGGGLLSGERRRLREGRLGHGVAGKQLVAAGEWLLGHGRVVRPAGRVERRIVSAPGFSGEMFLIYAKLHPFIKELREKTGDPHVFLNVEKVITQTKWGRDRLQFMLKRVEMMGQRRAERK
jgi:hypothetical protein